MDQTTAAAPASASATAASAPALLQLQHQRQRQSLQSAAGLSATLAYKIESWNITDKGCSSPRVKKGAVNRELRVASVCRQASEAAEAHLQVLDDVAFDGRI